MTLTKVISVTVLTVSSKPADDGHPRPPFSIARQSAPSNRRSSVDTLVSTAALLLWPAYLILLITLPEIDLFRKESITPIAALVGVWLTALIA